MCYVTQWQTDAVVAAVDYSREQEQPYRFVPTTRLPLDSRGTSSRQLLETRSVAKRVLARCAVMQHSFCLVLLPAIVFVGVGVACSLFSYQFAAGLLVGEVLSTTIATPRIRARQERKVMPRNVKD